MKTIEALADLPGAELVIAGLADLGRGVFDSTEALIIAIGAPRLRGLGFELPTGLPSSPEHLLYHRLGEKYGEEAHSKYNSLLRRLVSFERALDGRQRWEQSAGSE